MPAQTKVERGKGFSPPFPVIPLEYGAQFIVDAEHRDAWNRFLGFLAEADIPATYYYAPHIHRRAAEHGDSEVATVFWDFGCRDAAEQERVKADVNDALRRGAALFLGPDVRFAWEGEDV